MQISPRSRCSSIEGWLFFSKSFLEVEKFVSIFVLVFHELSMKYPWSIHEGGVIMRFFLRENDRGDGCWVVRFFLRQNDNGDGCWVMRFFLRQNDRMWFWAGLFCKKRDVIWGILWFGRGKTTPLLSRWESDAPPEEGNFLCCFLGGSCGWSGRTLLGRTEFLGLFWLFSAVFGKRVFFRQKESYTVWVLVLVGFNVKFCGVITKVLAGEPHHLNDNFKF